jgi:hypothetical protein
MEESIGEWLAVNGEFASEWLLENGDLAGEWVLVNGGNLLANGWP